MKTLMTLLGLEAAVCIVSLADPPMGDAAVMVSVIIMFLLAGAIAYWVCKSSKN